MRTPAWSVIVALALTALACKKSDKKPAPAPSAPAVAPTPAPAPTPTPEGAIAKPFLYEAQKGEAKLYLLGTIHLGIDADKQLPPWVFAALDGAPAFAMEADITDPGMIALLIRKDGGRLSTELGPEDWNLLREAIGPSLAEGMDQMKPFAALSTLATKDLPMTPPMDMTLHSRAKAAGKRLVYLETVADQLAAIEPFATAADIRALLRNRDQAKTQSGKMLADYAAGDGEALAAMFSDQTMWIAAGRDPARFGEFIEATMGKRNRSWVPKLIELAGSGGAFVAVGAAHLVGPDNVLGLLTAEGFTVRRVTGP